MCYSANVSLISSGVLILFGICMMIRRAPLDLMLAGFILVLSFIQIIEFGLHSNILSSEKGGRMLFITLLFQGVILSASVWAVTGSLVAAGIGIITISTLIVGWIATWNSKFSAFPGNCGHMKWKKDGGPLLGNFGLLYLFGLFAPFLVIAFAPTLHGKMNTHPITKGMIGCVLILEGILSALYVYFSFPASEFSSQWCVLSIFFSILAWILGSFY